MALLPRQIYFKKISGIFRLLNAYRQLLRLMFVYLH
jgi:hypothetical protein